MIYWQGKIVEKKYKKHVIIEDIEVYSMMVASIQVIIIWSKWVNHVFERSNFDDYKPGTCYLPITKQADEVGSILESVDPLLNDQKLYQGMGNHADLVK